MKTKEILKLVQDSRDDGQGEMTRLRTGDIIQLRTGQALVWKVNDCSATCLPLASRTVKFTNGRTGDEVEYQAPQHIFRISPNSEVEILQRLGKAGMITFLENKQNNTHMKEEKSEKKSKKEDEAPKLGKLGGFLGHSLTSVVRAMGKLGWEYWEAKYVFEKEEVAIAENTIRIQLSAGSLGKGGDPAPVTKALKELRPDPKHKPAKAAKAEKSKKAKSKGSDESAPSKKGKGKSKPAAEDDDKADDNGKPAAEADDNEAPQDLD